MIRGLQLIINSDRDTLVLAKAAIAGGVDSIQFRHKGPYTHTIYLAALALSELCRGEGVPLIVDDRFDIAVAINASGVHLGQSDIPLGAARRQIGKAMLIGATAGTLEQALEAERAGADYIGFGHIFPTRTKIKLDPPLGVEMLEQVCRRVSIPLLAIGGINRSNFEEVCRARVGGIALISAVADAPDPRMQVKEFKEILRKYG